MVNEPTYVRLLRALAEARRQLAAVEYETVRMAREAGATWQEIGDEFNMSRQAAASYFARPKGRRTPRPKD